MLMPQGMAQLVLGKQPEKAAPSKPVAGLGGVRELSFKHGMAPLVAGSAGKKGGSAVAASDDAMAVDGEGDGGGEEGV